MGLRRRRKKRQEETEPRGVRILHADGRVSECALVRDPQDRDGLAHWIAVPPAGTLLGTDDKLTVEVLPPRTSIGLSLTAQMLLDEP